MGIKSWTRTWQEHNNHISTFSSKYWCAQVDLTVKMRFISHSFKKESHRLVNELSVVELWETLLIRLEQIEEQADRLGVGWSVRTGVHQPGVGHKGRRRGRTGKCGQLDSPRFGHQESRHRPNSAVRVSEVTAGELQSTANTFRCAAHMIGSRDPPRHVSS